MHNYAPLYFLRQTISCYYVVNDTQSIAFGYKPRSSEPTAEIGLGRLMVEMRLSEGEAERTKWTIFWLELFLNFSLTVL